MKKVFLFFAALTLSVGLWAETVSYLYPVYNTDGDPTSGIKEWKTGSADATEITDASWNVTWGTAGTTTWYVVKGTDVQLTVGAVCAGDVRLILADGAKLTAKGLTSNNAGIQVSGTGNLLTIYAQSTDPVTMGQLKATGGWYGAGIGGGDGSNITINGGTITATGGWSGAGIGGGSGSNFTINGGTVTATGGDFGDAIDGGTYGSSDIFVATNLVVKVGDSAKDAVRIINVGKFDFIGNEYVAIEPLIATSYINEKGEAKTVDAIEVNPNQGYWGAGNYTTWYVVKGTDVQLSEGAICVGDVRLILADGAKLTATGWYDETNWIRYAGIQVSGNHTSLTIYAQSTGDQMGQLKATGGEDGGAGIGGGDGSCITINGGVIEATGGEGAAGIGIGGGDGSNITINGGTITATGGEYAAGIGGGNNGSGSNITINGGVIEATGREYAAGIGGGWDGSGSDITINGGTVKATGGEEAAGIGGGSYGSGSNITISGGTVTATGGSTGAGIGGGWFCPGSYITISGGTVTANGGNHGAGIGGGEEQSGSDITISGGTVIANGGEDAAGIGNGWACYKAASDIFVAISLVVKAGDSPNHTEEIAKTRTATTDIAGDLAGKQYAIVVPTTYTRDNLSNGKFGTICLAYAVEDLEGVGATFYKLNYFDESASALYLEEVDALAAGMPYIFEAKAESFTVTLIAAAPADADNENGLYGTLAEVVKTSDDIHSYAAISNNQVNVAENGNTVTVAANRAYIDMNEVSTTELAHSAPLRAIGVPRQTPTGNPSLHHSINSHTKGASLKIIEDGQFRIVREGKTYNAQGQIIQ